MRVTISHTEVVLPGCDPFWRLIVVSEHGQIFGFVDLSTCDAREASIRGLFVVECSRRQGFGRLLVGAAEGKAIDRGCSRLALEIDDPTGSSRLIAWYRSLGYELERQRQAQAERGSYCMSKAL